MQAFMAEHRIQIGRDAFFELLRNQGLLVRRRKRTKPQTTFSNHWLRKYQNLIIGLVPTAANQLWVSDITYVSVTDSFAYVSLITDAYSRKIVGFYTSEDLSAQGCIQALKMALNDSPYLISSSIIPIGVYNIVVLVMSNYCRITPLLFP